LPANKGRKPFTFLIVKQKLLSLIKNIIRRDFVATFKTSFLSTNKNMKRILIVSLFTILVGTGCKKDSQTTGNCINLKEAIINNDIELMRKAVNKLCDDVALSPAPGGTLFPSQMQDELVKALNQGVAAKTLCYFCIQTNPGQSEISVSAGGITRVIDIAFTNNQRIEFWNMHD
jgi:hypothetical protein